MDTPDYCRLRSSARSPVISESNSKWLWQQIKLRVLVRKARRVARCLWVGLLASSGCLWWAKRQLRGNGAVIALAFHRVLDDASYRQTHSLSGTIVRERTFRELVAYVARECEPVDLHGTLSSQPCSKLRVTFTFDDGWSDNYTTALPIAQANRVPLTIFVCPELVGKHSPFWPERVVALMRALEPMHLDSEIYALIESLKLCPRDVREQYLAKLSEQAFEQGISIEPSSVDGMLSWAEIEEMDRQGVNFGSHTQTHQILTTVPVETASQEVLESKAAIEGALNKRCDVFAYPNGNWSSATRRILAESGFRLAMTTECGAWNAKCDPLAIPRSNVHEDNLIGLTGRFSPAMFVYTTFWKPWRATRANSRTGARAPQQSVTTAV